MADNVAKDLEEHGDKPSERDTEVRPPQDLELSEEDQAAVQGGSKLVSKID